MQSARCRAPLPCTPTRKVDAASTCATLHYTQCHQQSRTPCLPRLHRPLSSHGGSVSKRGQVLTSGKCPKPTH
jgi:hypothetical protein